MKSSKTPIKPQAIKKPTAEELAAQRTRVLQQKMMSIAEASLVSLAGNAAYADKEPAELTERAIAIAEDWMAQMYHLVRKEEAK